MPWRLAKQPRPRLRSSYATLRPPCSPTRRCRWRPASIGRSERGWTALHRVMRSSASCIAGHTDPSMSAQSPPGPCGAIWTDTRPKRRPHMSVSRVPNGWRTRPADTAHTPQSPHRIRPHQRHPDGPALPFRPRSCHQPSRPGAPLAAGAPHPLQCLGQGPPLAIDARQIADQDATLAGTAGREAVRATGFARMRQRGWPYLRVVTSASQPPKRMSQVSSPPTDKGAASHQKRGTNRQPPMTRQGLSNNI